MPANAELTANGHSSMTSSSLALAAVLMDEPTGAGGNSESLGIELLQRATRDDYDRWLNTALAAGGCIRPVRLRGTVRDVDTTTGEILHGLDTEDLPDKAMYVPCGDRRASVCPLCAETYRADTYQLIRAGLAGGKGMPESLAAHPCVFATFTAPSFGPVHSRVVSPGGTVARCRPRRKASFCPHGRRLSCGQRHKDTDACLGRPLCPDCYDYSAAVVWNAHAPELWRRTTIAIRRRLDKIAKARGTRVKLSYAKVAEFQRRGLIHFHAVFRLDSHDPVQPERSVPPDPAFTAEVLAEVIQQVASMTWFATVSHPAKPRGWDITWGAQIDPRVVRLTGSGEVTDTKVAAYLAKYATKSTEPVGVPPGRITARNASIYADPGTYEGRLIAACLRLGVHSHEDFRALRRWAHMFGYRGHFAIKSRRYSTTMRALRAARRDWVRRQQPTARRENDGTVITVTDLRWAGRGWRTTGDALLALSAAARAREQRPALAHLPLRMITNGAVDRAVHGWIAEQCSRSTVKNSLAVLIRVMEQAVRDGIMDRNPARVIGWQREYQRAEDELDDPRSLALPDWQALCDLAAALVARSADHFEGWGDVVIFAACTAARIGEVSGIRCADIDRDAWTWTVRRQTTPSPGGLIDKGTKGKRARAVPLIDEVRPLVERRLDEVGHDPAARVFTGPRGGRITTAVLRDATHWDEVVTRLGYEHLRRHDLRHTGLTWMADAGVPVHVLRKIAGHGSLVTTQRYLHPDAQSIADAGTALSAHLALEKGSPAPQWSPNGPQLRLIEGDKA